MKKYRAIVVDDEKNVREVLELLLFQYCHEVDVVASASSAAEARELLKTHAIDFIFLDISMPKEDGFTFLTTIPKENYCIIFVTAFEDYALRALKASAIDYLLKPITPIDLVEAVSKAVQHYEMLQSREKEKQTYEDSLKNLSDNINHESKYLTRITVSEQFGFQIVNTSDIVYLEADSNYTIIHLSGLKKIVATRTMGDFEKILDQPEFFRIHKSIIINLNYLKAYSSYQGNFVTLNDGSTLSISRRRLNDFRDAIKHFTKSLD
ncbi:MAG: LytTR family DNA-binding domain-containing protein [Prolixibacteraceae bacterium]|jgi:two-component system LytT family response regulator|nr:LytTR family DNA-binding domain-containing protein [Prolixibacteraceae bacterium]